MATPVRTQAPVSVAPHSTQSSGNALLTWKNPQKTAKVFGGLIGGLLLIRYVNLLNLFFRLLSILLFVSGAAEYVGKLITGQGFTTRLQPNTGGILPGLAEEYVPKLKPLAQKLQPKLCGIVFAHDVEATLKALFVAYLLYKITSWFSFYTLVFTAVVFAFTGPFVYSTYEKEINEAKEKYSLVAKNKAVEYRDLVHEQAKPYISQVHSKVSPYTLKLSGYLPKNRTAGSTVGASPVPTQPLTSKPVATQPAASKPVAEPTVGTTSGSSVHETAAFPTVPSLQPLNAAAVDAADLKTSIQKDKAAAANAL